MALFHIIFEGIGGKANGLGVSSVGQRPTDRGRRDVKKPERKPTYTSINICNCHDFPLALPYNAKALHLPLPARHFHVSIFSQQQSLPSSPAPMPLTKRVFPFWAKGSHPLGQKGHTPLGKRVAPLWAKGPHPFGQKGHTLLGKWGSPSLGGVGEALDKRASPTEHKTCHAPKRHSQQHKGKKEGISQLNFHKLS